MTTLRGDLDLITSILEDAFRTEPFKRDYEAVSGRVADIMRRHGLTENPRNLRFRFILCMQEFFDGIPQDQWQVKDPSFVKRSADFAISAFREWIVGQVT